MNLSVIGGVEIIFNHWIILMDMAGCSDTIRPWAEEALQALLICFDGDRNKKDGGCHGNGRCICRLTSTKIEQIEFITISVGLFGGYSCNTDVVLPRLRLSEFAQNLYRRYR